MLDEAPKEEATDARRIAALLIAEALCLACIETKSEVSRARIGAFLQSVERNLLITTRRAKCAGCGRIVMTYRLGEHSAPWLASW